MSGNFICGGEEAVSGTGGSGLDGLQPPAGGANQSQRVHVRGVSSRLRSHLHTSQYRRRTGHAGIIRCVWSPSQLVNANSLTVRLVAYIIIMMTEKSPTRENVQ